MSSIFNKRGDYARPSDPLGQWSDSLLLAVPQPLGTVSESLIYDNRYNPAAARDLERIAGTDWRVNKSRDFVMPEPGTGLESPHVRQLLTDWGYDPDTVQSLPTKKRVEICNRLIKLIRSMGRDPLLALGGATVHEAPGGYGLGKVTNREEPMAVALLNAKPKDTALVGAQWGKPVEVTIEALRKLLRENHGLTPEAYAALSHKKQNRIFDKMSRFVMMKNVFKLPRAEDMSASTKKERTDLHVALRPWAKGPLKLERPQGSSYHHLLEYDKRCLDEVDIKNDGMSLLEIARRLGNPELMVVENDWASALSGVKGVDEGEVRMPFEHACWEFRISGVRVLAFVRTDDTDFETHFFCVYGRDGAWVADDYCYSVVTDKLVATPHFRDHDNYEFRHVAALVWRNVRASCIMLDARVARSETSEPSEALVSKRRREGRSVPRAYMVVRLLRQNKVQHRPRVAIAPGARTPQGGHVRRGTWMHYDDPDSGREQYPNDGGFIVSKTWRRWHFAGDLSRMIQREYRL